MTLGRSFFWLFFAEFLFYASGYVVHMGAGRILGVEDYGRYTLVITVTILVANLVGAGLPIAMGKFLSEAHAQKDSVLARVIKKKVALWQMLFMVFLGGGFFFLAPLLAGVLGDPTLAPLFVLASLIIPLYGADLYYFHYYSGLKRFDVQSWLKMARSILRMSIILGFAYWFHLAGMIAGYIVVPLIVFLLAWGIDHVTQRETLNVKRWKKYILIPLLQLKERFSRGSGGGALLRERRSVCARAVHRARMNIPRRTLNAFTFSRAWKLAGATILFLASFEILVSFDVYFLKYFFGSDTLVGEYNASLTIARIPTFLFYALTIILLPTISQSHALQDTNRAKKLISLVLKYMSFVTLAFVFLLVAFPRTIVQLIFGAEFAQATLILPGLGVALGLLTFLYVLGFAFIATGRAWIPVAIGIGALCANIFLATILASSLGMLGVILAKLVTAFFVFFSVLIASRRVFDAGLGWKNSSIAVGLSLTLFALGTVLSLNTLPLGGVVLMALGFGVLYIAILFLLGVVSRDDLALVREKA